MNARVKFSHPVYSPAGTFVKLPIGSEDLEVSLNRDPNYHSVVELFESNFVWVGNALTFIKAIESTYGPDSEVGVLYEINLTGVWETLFNGNLSITQIENLTRFNRLYKVAVPIIRDSVWARFMNNRSTKIDYLAATDIYGSARTAFTSFKLPLPSQTIKLSSNYRQDAPVLIGTLYDYTFSDPSIQEDIAEDEYLSIDFDNIILDEVKVKKNIGTLPTEGNLPEPIQVIDKDGTYTYDIKANIVRAFHTSLVVSNQPKDVISFRNTVEGGAGRALTLYFKINNEPAIEFAVEDKVAIPLVDPENWSEYTYNGVHSLKAGDVIRVYGRRIITGAYGYANNSIFRSINQIYLLHDTTTIQLSGGGFVAGDDLIVFRPDLADYGVESYFSCIGETEFNATETDAALVGDSFHSVLSKIIGQDDIMDDGIFATDHRLNANMLGLHVRGLLMSSKKFFISFDDLWKVWEPVLNLGIGYTNANKIVIKKKEDFYNPSPSVFLNDVRDIKSVYDTKSFYKSVEVGYSKSFIESRSGLQDAQTKRSWISSLKTTGEPRSILSNGFFASVGIEETRRSGAELTKDFKTDNDIVGIAVKVDGSSYAVETGADFDTITNLEFSDKRYNVRHFCARVFKRWLKFLDGFMFSLTDEFKFSSGEGNYTVESKGLVTDFEGDDTIAENQNFVNSGESVMLTDVFTCYAAMDKQTYDTIKSNRDNAIAIKTEVGYLAMFILEFRYKVFKGRAQMKIRLHSKEVVEPVNVIGTEAGNFIGMETGGGLIGMEE